MRRQHLGIDLLVTLDDQWDVVVEDKVYSQQHSGQLKRYIDALVAKGRERDWALPLYVQTGDQADYSAVVRDGYQSVWRQDLPKCCARSSRRLLGASSTTMPISTSLRFCW